MPKQLVTTAEIEKRQCKVYVEVSHFHVEWKAGEFVTKDRYWDAVGAAREKIVAERLRVKTSVPFSHVEACRVKHAVAVGQRQHGVAYYNLDDADRAIETCSFGQHGDALAPLSDAEVREYEALLAEQAAVASKVGAFRKTRSVDIEALVEAEIEAKVAAKIEREIAKQAQVAGKAE